MTAVRHLEFLKMCSFCHVAFVGMPFCFLVQNFAEIRKSVDELWPKKAIFKMAAAAIYNFKNFNFWGICYMYRILSKSDDFSLTYDDLTIFKMAAVRHLGFYIFADFCHLALVDMLLCFLVQNFAKIGQSVDELWPKKLFSRWRPPPS